MAALMDIVAFSIPKESRNPTFTLKKISENRGMTPKRYMADILERAFLSLRDSPTLPGKYTAFKQPNDYNTSKVGELYFKYDTTKYGSDVTFNTRILSGFTEEFFNIMSSNNPKFCPESTFYLGFDPERSGGVERSIASLGVRGIAREVTGELIKEGIEHSVRFFEHEEVMQQELTDLYLKLAQEK